MGHLGACCSIDPVGCICYDDTKDPSVKFSNANIYGVFFEATVAVTWVQLEL